MPVRLSEATVNRTRGVEVEIWTLAGNDFTFYLNWLNCTAAPFIGWTCFAPIIQPWTESRRELPLRVFEAWIGLMSWEQFIIWTIAVIANFLLREISRIAAKLGGEGLTVVALVRKPRTSSNGKLLLGIFKAWIGHLPLCLNQVARLVDHILFTVLGVWWKAAFGK